EDGLRLDAQRLVTEEIVDLDKRDPPSRAKLRPPRCERARQVREISRGEAAPHAIGQDTQVRKGGQVVLPKLRILQRPGPRIAEQLLADVDPDYARASRHELGGLIADCAAEVQDELATHRR